MSVIIGPTKPYRIILIGPPGSGKTSIATAWARLVGGYRLSFADALRRELAVALMATNRAATPTHIHDYIAAMTNPTTKNKYRALLQAWGTDYRRVQDPDYWLHPIRKAIDESSVGAAPLIVDDCRFDNEYKMLTARRFFVVALESGPTAHELPMEQQQHKSEQQWRQFAPLLTLSYESGPQHQARRLIGLLAGLETV